MTEPTALDRETAAYLMHFVKGAFNYDDFVDVLSRALAAERDRVLDLTPEEMGQIVAKASGAVTWGKHFEMDDAYREMGRRVLAALRARVEQP